MTTLDHRPDLPLTRLRMRNPMTWERNGDRRDRLHRALSELFGEREDLAGVSAVADVLAEDLLWSV